MTYAGHYANATGNLKLAPDDENGESAEDKPGAPNAIGQKWTWAKLIARVWH